MMVFWQALNWKCKILKKGQKKVYDYRNADISGLIDHIKHYDFNTALFTHPIRSKILIDGLNVYQIIAS